MQKIGAVAVVGAGIGGSQAALDLADAGFKVYLVESTTSIGGVMAQLDKTFPTNDCAICIVSPKLVEAGRHPNIDILINSKINKVTGDIGNFNVDLTRFRLYIDEEKSTGCGVCGQECPVEAIDVVNEGLSIQKATSVKYPQAVPLVYSINKDVCIGCGICKGVCKANAVKYELADEPSTLNVGAIVLAPGFDEFDPKPMKRFGYGKYKNVVTSIEFERILSASGPFAGKVLRPSDGDIPTKVAFLQCIGSRDSRDGRPYCSSVCCMYTCKEAVIAHEHQHQVHPTIFYMDIRAYGKDFDKYIERAKHEYGVRYVKSRVSSVEEVPGTRDLKLTYEDDAGDIKQETFNMVVLAVGLDPPKDARHLAEKFGIELNEYDFAKTSSLNPVETTRPGVFVCGAFSQPKDIPETVIEASAAAGKINAILAPVRNTLISKKEYLPEIDVSEETPRVGVFICHCGINIGGVVDVPAVTEYAKKLPDVVIAENNLYTCSADTQVILKKKISEHKLNRVIVASCTPRTHEPLFQETIREAGLNKYLFTMTNIRDQCSWVHMHEPEAATEKAKDLVRMVVERARLSKPLPQLSLNVTQKAMVIGGGVSGMSAALGFAEQGIMTYLIEKEDELGGFGRKIKTTLEGADVGAFIGGLVKKISSEPKIKVFTSTDIDIIDGYLGNFKTTLKSRDKEITTTIDHGVVVVATGATEYRPKEYLYGQDPRIVTQLEFERKLDDPGRVKGVSSIVMIQCVGSRNEENPYCSRVCCSEAIKNALKMKEMNPKAEIVVLFRDMRTYGFKEKYYSDARTRGVIFLRYEAELPPQVSIESDAIHVNVQVKALGTVSFTPSIVVLSNGIVALKDENAKLSKMLKVPLNEQKFFLEAHVKLRPVDFATEGIFLSGTARAPVNIDESIAQAHAAVSRAMIILSKDSLTIGGAVSVVDKKKCTGCNICIRTCPFNAIVKDEGYAFVREALCKGCGVCGASCPEKAISIKHFTNDQIISEIHAMSQEQAALE